MSHYVRNKKTVIATLIFSLSLICLTITLELNFLTKGQTLILSFIRIILGYILLAYIPGNLFLKLIGINLNDIYDEIAYSVGLSLSIVMIVGFIINIFYPLIGIPKPISIWPLLLTFCIINLIFSYLIDLKYNSVYKSKMKYISITVKQNFLPCLYICLLPILAVVGASYASFNYNFILICLISLISLIPLMVVTDKIFKEPIYPLAIYMISLALLLHNTMVSQYPMRINVDVEYYYQQLVIQNGYWNSNISISTNTALSVVMIAPIFEQLLNLNINWILRCGYPILFSFVPFILYNLYSKQFDKKSAFLSTCFLMFYFYFFIEATLLRRQQVALIFFSLILLLTISDEIVSFKKRLLMIIFTFSLIVSHYSLALIVLLLFFIIYTFLTIVEIDFIQAKVSKQLFGCQYNFSKSYILIFVSIILTWFLYVGNGNVFSHITLLGNNIYQDFFLQYGKSTYINQALGAGFFDVCATGKIYRLLQYSSQLFIVIGSIISIVKQKKIIDCYLQFVIAALILLFIVFFTPYLSTLINIFRIYFVLLLILAPFCLVGANLIYCSATNYLILFSNKLIFNYNNKTLCPKCNKMDFKKVFVIFFLLPYFLFNVGVVFEIGGFNKDNSKMVQIPISPSLTYDSNSGYHQEKEIVAAKKIGSLTDKKIPIYGDMWIGYDLISAWNNNSKLIYTKKEIIGSPHYIFLRDYNILSGKFEILSKDSELDSNDFKYEDQIYDNGNVSILGQRL